LRSGAGVASRDGTARIDDARLTLTPLGKLLAKLPVDVKVCSPPISGGNQNNPL
jgi:hypothetical protein